MVGNPTSAAVSGENLQMGLSNLLLLLGNLPQSNAIISSAVTFPSSSLRPSAKYNYLINPRKKSDFTLRNWHDVSEKFLSIGYLKFKLMDTFPKEFSGTTNFQVIYLEPPNQAKRWLCDNRDINRMYSEFPSGSRITFGVKLKRKRTVKNHLQRKSPDSYCKI